MAELDGRLQEGVGNLFSTNVLDSKESHLNCYDAKAVVNHDPFEGILRSKVTAHQL